MTIAKASRLQDDLRDLFNIYGITSGFAMVIHDGTLHPIEVHITERNPLIVQLMDSFTDAAKAQDDIPVAEIVTTKSL